MEQSLEISLSDWMKRKQETSSVDVITAPYGFPLRVLAFTILQNLSDGVIARSHSHSSNVTACFLLGKKWQNIFEAERLDDTLCAVPGFCPFMSLYPLRGCHKLKYPFLSFTEF